MKTRNLFFAFVALLVSATVYATETPKTEILSAQNDKILVNYQTDTPCLLEVSITDNNGVILHEWKSETPQSGVKKIFSLKELEDGTYQFSLKSGTKSLNSALTIDDKTVKVGPMVELNEPCFRFKNDKLYVSFLNQSMKNVYLKVYKDGEQYNGFDFGKNFDVQKCIDFSMATNGTYDIVLSESHRAYNFRIYK
ncbi:MAG: hypothetical protein AB7S72_11935 [Draconibacterium sp.]